VSPRPLAAIQAARRQRAVLSETAHRPWPLPSRRWFMGQSWRNLLFAHWSVDAAALERVVPPQIPLDLRDGRAWVGITPFRVEGLRLRNTPPPPLVSRFEEANVRTYVSVGGRPGIYFLSLDSASAAAVAAARRTYRLPYFRSDMRMGTEGDGLKFEAHRVSPDGPPARLRLAYGPTGERFTAQPGTLEHWLTERYCLYTLAEGGTVQRGEIHHPPWPLQPASATIFENTMTDGLGIDLPGDPVLHFSAMQDVVLWAIEPVR
jgi:uncharacterized protein YqjF (DUF2071 family)